MNRIYRHFWRASLNDFILAPEFARSKTKGGRSRSGVIGAVVAISLSSAQLYAHEIDSGALPDGAVVTSGTVTMNREGTTLNITQETNRAAINWQNFSIGSNSTVNFAQPSASAAVLNRVVGNETSVIEGALNANGQVFILNANGVLFGKNAQVNTAGLVASTLELSDKDFNEGNYTFQNNGSTASVVNLGTIKVEDGKFVALLGNQVRNEGVITANMGTAVLAAGDKISLNFNGDSLVGVTVDKGTLQALVENRQAIIADGGLIVMTAKGLEQVMETVVNNSGEIRASTIAERDGKIFLSGGEDDRAIVSGTVDARGIDGNGGEVVISAGQVGVLDGAHIDASGASGGGKIKVGGGFQGKDSEVLNASTTYVASGAELKANATEQGDGGEVVVWADDSTRYFGRISATGGTLGGDGGQAEVSGKQHLNFSGEVDLTANRGEIGTLLLDPTDLTISSGADANLDGDGSVGDPFAPDAASAVSILNIATLQTALSTSNVVVSTVGSPDTTGEAGDITVADTFGWFTSRNLTLQAEGSILINQGVEIISSNGSLTLSAGDSVLQDSTNNTSRFRIAGTTSVTATTGSISLASQTNEFIGAVSTTAGGAISLTNDRNLLLGNLQSGGTVNISTTAASNGNIANTGATTFDADAAVTITSGGRGFISLINIADDLNFADVTALGGAISLTGLGDLTFGDISTSAPEDTGITSGNVNISAAGNITGDDINTLGQDNIDGSGATAGNVTVTTSNGAISLGDISAHGGQGQGAVGGGGGSVILQATGGSGTIEVGEIDTTGGGNVAVAGIGFNGGNAGNIKIQSHSNATITLNGDISSGGGAGGGSNPTGLGGNMNFTGAVVVTDDRTISSGATSGTITFTGTIDSDGTARDVTVVAGEGDTLFEGVIGGTSALGAFDAQGKNTTVRRDITADRGITLSSNISNGGVTTVGYPGSVSPVTMNTMGDNGAITFTGAVNLQDNLTLTRGTGDISFGNSLVGQNGTHDLTVNGTGGGDLSFANGISNLGDISLSTLKNLEVRGSVTAESLVYQDQGTGTAEFLPVVVGNTQTYSQAGGFVVRTADDITINTAISTGTAVGGASLIAESSGGALSIQTNLSSNNGAISLGGVSVSQSAERSINAGSGTILVDGGGSFISLAGNLTTTNADSFNSVAGPAILLRDASTITLLSVTALNGTLQFGTASGAADVSGAVAQIHQANQGINVKTLAANTDNSIAIDSAWNNIENLGAIELDGNLAVRDEVSGLAVLENLTASQVTINSGYGVLALGNSDITATSGPVELRGNGITQLANSTVDATNSTIAIIANAPNGVGGAIDLAGTLTTTSDLATAVHLYYASSVTTGNIITGDDGGVVLGNGADVGAINQTSGTSISTSNLLVSSRGIVNLNGNNDIDTLSGVVNFGGFTLNDASGGLQLTGGISGWFGNPDGSVTLSTAGGALDLNAQTIVGHNISLSGEDVISSVSGGTIHGGSGTVLIDAGGGEIGLANYLIHTANNTSTAVQFVNAEDDVVLGQINAISGTVVLGGTGSNSLRGNVTQNNVITAAMLTGNTTGSVTLTNNNLIANLGNFTAGGAFSLVDSTDGLIVSGAITTTPDTTPDQSYVTRPLSITSYGGALNLTGSLDGDGVSLTANNGFGVGSIILAGNIQGVSGAVNLVAQGTTINQTGGVVSTTGALTGSAVTGVSLTGANELGGLGPFAVSGSGDFTVNDVSGGLTLAGNVTVNNGLTTITTAGGALDLDEFDITTSGNILLTGSGVSQATNSIVNANAGTILVDANGGDVAMSGQLATTNTTSTAVTLRDADDVSVGSVTALSGMLTIGVGGDVTGDVTQSASTAFNVDGLVVNTSGSVDLAASTNRINSLNSIVTLGNFYVNDFAGGLILEDNVVAGNGSTPGAIIIRTGKGDQAGGTLTISDFDITSFGNLELQGLGISSSALSTIDATSGNITLSGNDGVDPANGAITLQGTVATTSNTTSAVRIIRGTSLGFASISTGANGTTTFGGVGADALTGTVTQTGALVTGTLAGNSAQTTLNHSGNVISNLGPYSATGAFELLDSQGGLNLSGDVQTAGTTTITTQGLFNMGLYDLIATGSPLTLTAQGVTQNPTGGTSTIQAGTTLVEGGAGVVELTSSSNDFTGVVTLRGTGSHVQVRDTNNLTLTALTGQIGPNTGVTAIAGSTLVLANEDLNTGAGDIYLQSAGGNLTTTGTLTTSTGSIGLHASEILTVNHAITAAGGDIELSGGNIEHNDQDVTTTGAGTIDVTAVGGGVSPNTGRINMVDGTEYTTGTGQITLSALTDSRVSRTATSGVVSITATNGKILDVLIAETANISAASAVLSADTGIGLVNDALDLDLAMVRATGDTGGIYLSSEGDLQLGDSIGGITLSGIGDIDLTTAGDVSIANDIIASDGNIQIKAAGSVSKASGATGVQISAESLAVITTADAGADIDLSETDNTVDQLSLRTVTADESNRAAGDIKFTSTTGFTITAIETSADTVLDAQTVVNQTGTIISDGLGLTGTAAFDLSNSSNEIQRFASDATGDVDLTVSTDLRLASINPAGITTGGADVTIVAASFDADGFAIDSRSPTSGADGGSISITTTGSGANGNLNLAVINSSGRDAQATSGLAGGDAGQISLSAGGTLTFTDNVTGVGGAGDGAGLDGSAGTLIASASAIEFNGGNIIAGAQTYTGPMSLLANTSITSVDNSVEFDGSLDGAFDLTVSALNGNVTVGQPVGATAELANISVSAAQIRLNGGEVSTTGNQSYDGAIVVGADTSLEAGGTITLDGTVDSSSTASVSDQNDLNVQSGSTLGLQIAHAIGGTHRIGTLRLESAGVVTQTGTAPIKAARLAIKSAGNATLTHASNDVDVLAGLLSGGAQLSFVDADGVEIGVVSSGNLQVIGISDGAGSSDVRLVVGGLLTQAVNAPIVIDGNLSLDSTAFNAGHVNLRNTAATGTELGNSLVAGDFTLDSTGNITQTEDANGVNDDAYLQVGGNFNVTGTGEFVEGNSLDNFIGGGSTFASGATVRLFGVVTLSMNGADLLATADDGTNTTSATIQAADLAGGITIISSDGGQNISPVANALAIDLQGMNSIGGVVDITTQGNYSVSSAVATGIKQDGALDIAAASFVVRPSGSNATSLLDGAGRLDLSDAGNQFSGPIALSAIGMEAHVRATTNLVLADVNVNRLIAELDSANSTLAITQATGARLRASEVLLRNAGNTTLDGANQVGMLAAHLNGDLVFNNAQTLTVGTVSGVQGITTTNSDVTLQTTIGDLILTQDIVVPSDANITLVSAGNFINQAGTDALEIGNGAGAGVWRIWSTAPASDVLGGLEPDFKHYNANYGATDISGIEGYGVLYRYAPQISVELIGTVERVYNAQTTATLTQQNYQITGLETGDSVELSTDALFADKHVNNPNSPKTVTTDALAIVSATESTANGDIRVYGYQLNPTSLDSNGEVAADIGFITPATISAVTGISAGNKVYDGTSTASLVTSNAQFTGMFSGDVLGVINATGQFATPNANASAQTVSISGITLSGSDAGNYVLANSSATTSATISPFAVSLTGQRGYDGTNQISSGDLLLGALIGAETLTLSGNGLMADKHAGNDKALTDISGLTLQSGTGLASNYTLVGGNHEVDVTQAQLVITTNAVNRSYNGTLAANGIAIATSGTQLFDDDSLSGGSFAFTDANAGAGKTVNVSNVSVQDGNGGNNYQVTYAANTGSEITQALITVSTANVTKTYDGTTSAQGTAVVTAGTLYNNASNGNATDSLMGGSFAFDNANAGDGNKTVTVSGVTINDGNGGGNYQIQYEDNSTSTINRYVVDLTGSRVYNGTWTVGVDALSLGNLVGNETLQLAGSGSVLNRNVSANQTINVTGISLVDGANSGLASNYTLLGGTHTFDITPAPLSVQVVVDDKVYDGNRNGTIVDYVFTGLASTETLTVSQSINGTTLFDDRNAGEDKTVTITGITLSDGDNGGLVSNYVFDVNLLTAVADIDKKQISVSGLVAFDKVYDGSTSVRTNADQATLIGMVDGDIVGVNTLTAVFADKNAGEGKLIVADDLSLQGPDANNYDLILPNNFTATIHRRVLAISATGQDKIYDGSTSAQVTLNDNRVAGDVLSVGFDANFLDANAGQNKYINVGDIELTGQDADNYTSEDSVGAYANVAQRAIQVSTITGATKTYDGSASIPSELLIVENLVDGDVLNIGGNALSSKNAGVRTINLGGITLGNSNYTVVGGSAAGSVLVTPKVLSITGTTAGNKSYDGTTAAIVNPGNISGFVGDETLNVAATGEFDNENVGNRTVMAHYALSNGANGGLAGNYILDDTFHNAYILPTQGLEAIVGNLVQADVNLANTNIPTIPNPIGQEALTISRGQGNVVTVPQELELPSADANNLLIVSSTSGDTASGAVTLSDAQRMMDSSDDNDGEGEDGEREVRVPVSRNSLAEIVNGGVHLPDGVEQQLFVVER